MILFLLLDQFIAFQLDPQNETDGEMKKRASLLVVSWFKTINKLPPSLCDRQVVKTIGLITHIRTIMTTKSNQVAKLFVYI